MLYATVWSLHHRWRKNTMSFQFGMNVATTCINLFVLHAQIASLAWLDSAIVSKTRQRHRTMVNVTSATSSPARLGSDITPRLTSPQQRHQQHDSATRHGQVTSVVPHQHDSAASSSVWLSIYITLRSSCLDSAITSITQHLHLTVAKSPRQHRLQHDSISTSRHDQVTLLAPSSAWLDIYIISQPSCLGITVSSMTQHLPHAAAKSPQKHRC
jgi:hypothetical protein